MNNILVVDDTIENLRLLTQILTQQGYLVRPAPNGMRALIAAQEGLPDLILLDIMMPDMDGYEVCQRLKADPQTQDIPIIFISALHEVLDKVKAFGVGGVDYITKPYQEAEVLARVQTHLTMRQLQQELRQKNEALHHANDTLEAQVAARTLDLTTINMQLAAEVEQRKQHQTEKEHLLTIVRQQSDQLRTLTLWLMEAQQTERQGLAQILRSQVSHNLELMRGQLKLLQDLIGQNSLNSNPALISTYLAELDRYVLESQTYMSQVTGDLTQVPPSQQEVTQAPQFKLTSREWEVLQLLSQGKSNVEIANLLNLSVSTTKTYRARLMTKLELNSTSDLVKFAIRHGLSSVE